jgi:hypothetical protein
MLDRDLGDTSWVERHCWRGETAQTQNKPTIPNDIAGHSLSLGFRLCFVAGRILLKIG